MAVTAIRQDHVVAKDTFLDRADPLDGFLGALIALIGFQLYADAFQGASRVGIGDHSRKSILPP